VDDAEFAEALNNNQIFEYTRTYGDYCYGSPVTLLAGDNGADYIVELDYKGMFRVRAATIRQVISIFIIPPLDERLVERIQGRRTEQNLSARLATSTEQLQFAWCYDYILINEDLDRFLSDASSVVNAEFARRHGVNTMLAHRQAHDPTLSGTRPGEYHP
jgi:guanylate kinase